MIYPALLMSFLAGPPTVETAEEVAAQAVQIAEISNELQVVAAYMQDEEYVRLNLTPSGWVQPSYETYELELGGRPSMLPLEAYAEAVTKAGGDLTTIDLYVSWQAQQVHEIEAQAASAEVK